MIVVSYGRKTIVLCACSSPITCMSALVISFVCVCVCMCVCVCVCVCVCACIRVGGAGPVGPAVAGPIFGFLGMRMRNNVFRHGRLAS